MSQPTPPTKDDQQAPARPWSQPRFLLAAAGLALLVVAAVVLAVLPPSADDEQPAPAPSTTASAAPTLGGQDASVCGLPEGDQAVPVVPPSGTSWDLVGTMAAPSAPQTLGPGVDTGGLRSCYARSPLGALYAATGFLAATTDPALRLPAFRDLTLPGPGQQRALDLMTGAAPGGGGSGVQIAGFSFLNYDTTSAVIDVALRVEATPMHLPVTVRWAGGDWKVVLPDTGQPYEAIQPLPNLTGYAPWSGA